jgi:hypothetical protein
MTISRRIFVTASSLIAVFLLGLSDSRAIELKNASYFCTVEFAGGLAFNESLKKWDSAKFLPHRKFVLKLQFISKGIQKDAGGKDQPVADFKVALTEAGTNDGSYCFPQDYKGLPSMIGTFDYLNCFNFPSEYQFNLKTNRFLSYYKFGYLEGKDNNDDTPAVSGGTCTKID